ncbi:MAG: glycolate oxidase [Gammaproteobacteria bacterium SG8_31]|nr:MAG: glycolate oxidase [Gammaproteobacteria bacterium SG8_31]
MGGDRTDALRGAVCQAAGVNEPLEIVGSGSKRFYGRTPAGTPLDVSGHRGVVSFEPSELVLTARAGTRLDEIESLLADQGQMLAFDPPRFGNGATLGGTVACNFSGPRRPFTGAVRDFVLGVRLINGKGEVVRFGGEVMKNVAGYDVSRLMAGAMGTLGLLLEISLKILPAPETEQTRRFELDQDAALETMCALARRPLPLSASAWLDGAMMIRLSGSETGVKAAADEIGGEPVSSTEAETFWRHLREHELEFFRSDQPLWRISVAPASCVLALPGQWLIDWGGAQRWLYTPMDSAKVRKTVAAAGGHAVVFRGGDRAGSIFHPLEGPMLRLHGRVKDAMDPHRIFNPGRMYESF